MVEVVTARITANARVAVLHSVAPELGQSVAARIEEKVRPSLIVCNCVGPTVGTHTGPGAVGVTFLP
jgi:fatty acid-binding protein DegV